MDAAVWYKHKLANTLQSLLLLAAMAALARRRSVVLRAAGPLAWWDVPLARRLRP